jgi:2-dehydro-3-deoxyphosphogluconate aldolase/(4S)-4-hydroxy-2-oxoglutarate aldolase
VNQKKAEILERLHRHCVVAIIRCDSSEPLIHVVSALQEGGITTIEITLTTPGAIELIREIDARFGAQVVVGAGTVMDVEQAGRAIEAGAEFIVGPTFNPQVVAHCNKENVVVIPGALTPTEIQTAWRAGADIVKIFPASIGGPGYFRDLKGPLPGIRMMPTGGVDTQTAPQFLAAGAFAVGVGGAVVGSDLIRDGKFDEIKSRSRKFVFAIESARKELKLA